MTADYAGDCVDCGSEIAPGDIIRPADGGWAHDDCGGNDRDNAPVCPDCFLIHPIGVCDQ
jgi:hypothetical protein